MSKPYKDVMGRYRTQSLFIEMNVARDEFDSPYTIKDQDHVFKGKTYPSLKRIYIDMEDPTEYTFAMATLGSWEHWEIMTTRKWFQPHLEAWRTELEIKLKADAIVTIKKISKDTEDSRALQAARYLADQGWLPKPEKGRPTKEATEREIKKSLIRASELDADAERIGLELNKPH